MPRTYATWNPSDKDAGITLSNGNLTMVNNQAYQNDSRCVRSTLGYSSGKWYWELTMDVASNPDNYGNVGVMTSAASLTAIVGLAATGWGYMPYDGKKYNNGSAVYGDTYTAGIIIGIALDMDNGKIWFRKGETWQASGDPAAGTNAAFTNVTGTVYAAANSYMADSGAHTQWTANFGATAFTYTVPTGFNTGIFTPVNSIAVTDIYSRIRDLLNEDSASFWTNAELLRFMNDAERDIAIKSLCLQHIDALTTSNGVRTVSFNGYKTMYLEYVKSTTLGIGVNNILSSAWGHTPSLGTDPQNWFERGTNLYIEPIPAATLNLNAYIADYPAAEMASDPDAPEIPETFVPLIVLYVVAMCLFKDRRYAQAQQIYSMYMNELLYQKYTLVDIIPDVKAATNFHDFNKVT